MATMQVRPIPVAPWAPGDLVSAQEWSAVFQPHDDILYDTSHLDAAEREAVHDWFVVERRCHWHQGSEFCFCGLVH